MKNMKLVLERWDKYVKEEEKEEILEEVTIKQLLLALPLIVGGGYKIADYLNSDNSIEQVDVAQKELVHPKEFLHNIKRMEDQIGVMRVMMKRSDPDISGVKEYAAKLKFYGSKIEKDENVNFDEIYKEVDDLILKGANPDTREESVDGFTRLMVQFMMVSNPDFIHSPPYNVTRTL